MYSATGRNVVYERMFDEVIVARAVKIIVTSFQGDYACLRVELYGSPCGKSVSSSPLLPYNNSSEKSAG